MDSLCALSNSFTCPCTYVADMLPDVGLYWRSDVVMAGIGISAVGTIISLIQGYTLVALISFVATCILSFAFYYVEAYVTLTKLEDQIKSFTTQVSSLKGEIAHLQEIQLSLSTERTLFSEANTQLQVGIYQIQQENTTLHTEVSRLTQINDLMNGRLGTLAAATAQVNAVMEQMTRARGELNALTAQIQVEGTRHSELNRQCAYLQGEIARETTHLQEIASRFATYADSLQTTTQDSRALAAELRIIAIAAQSAVRRPL